MRRVFIFWIASLLCACCLLLGPDAFYGDSENAGFLYEAKIIQNQAITCNTDLPVSIRFYRVTKTQTVEIHITLPEIDDDYYLYKETITLTKDEEQTVSMVVPVQMMTGRFRVQIFDSDGQELCSTFLFPKSMEQTEDKIAFQGLFVGRSLVFKPGSLSFLTNDLDFSLYPSFVSLEQFPKDVCYLREYELIVIPHLQYRQLSEDQKHAIICWVSEGGLLFVPSVKQDEILEGEQSLVKYLGDGAGVFLSKDYYNGILYMENSIRSMLVDGCGLLPKKVIEATIQAKTRGEWSKNLQDSLIFWEFSIPALKLYFFVLAVYVFIGLPGIYLFLKGIGKRYYMRGSVILVSILFALLIYVLGSNTRMNRNYLTSLAVWTMDDQYESLQAFSTCQTAYGTSQTLKTLSGFEYHPMMKTGQITKDQWNKVTLNDTSFMVSQNEEGTFLSLGNKRFGTNHFFAERTLKNEEGHISAELSEALLDMDHGIILSNDGTFSYFDKSLMIAALKTGQLPTNLVWQKGDLYDYLFDGIVDQDKFSLKQKQAFYEYLQLHDYLVDENHYLLVGFGDSRKSVVVDTTEECLTTQYHLFIRQISVRERKDYGSSENITTK